MDDIGKFYLEDHDFQVYVNKDCQAYDRTLEKELISPITIEYYKSLQKGGYNEAKHRYPVS